MLTGDKLETAENIGFSCKLVQNHFKKMYLKAEEGEHEFSEQLLNRKYENLLMEMKKKKN